jgi:hypothetical protein
MPLRGDPPGWLDLAPLHAALDRLPPEQLPDAIGALEAAKARAWARLAAMRPAASNGAPAQTPRVSTQTCPRVSTARRRATLRIEALEAEWVLRHALARWLDAVEACRRANAADCARNPRRMASWVQGQVAHLVAWVRA